MEEIRRIPLLIDANTNDVLYEAELVSTIMASDTYIPAFKYKTVKEYLINFVSALVYNKPIILVDSDFSESELSDLELKDTINVRQPLGRTIDLKSIDWIDCIHKSSSIISLFTSGTTGLPKVVNHTVTSLTRMVRTGNRYINNRWVLAYNPTHMAGVQVIFQALFNRNVLLNIFQANLEIASKFILSNNATHISGTPTFYRLLTGYGISYPNIIRATLGGEKSSSELHDKIGKVFPNAKINNIYASTELGSLFVSDGESFKVPVDIADKIEIAQDGELLVHGSLIPSINDDSEWYHTGDLVELVCLNPIEFIFLNRKTEMINVGGYKVNPIEVENTLLKFPGIITCRVYKRENSVLGNILCADIQMNEGVVLKKRELLNFLSDKLQDYKIPRVVREVSKVAVTRTGKIIR